jgi:hypothetical protein
MKSTILRILRVLVAQVIGLVLTTWGGVTIPYFSVTVGAVINGIFKFIRDKFPKSVILEWLPI